MLTISTHINGGKLIIDNRKRFAAELTTLKDGVYELTLRKKNRRSNHQNRYLWGYVYKEMQFRINELGNDFSIDDVHDFCKTEFNKKEIVGVDGEVIGYKGGSTANMNKEEFSVYLDKIIFFAAETLLITIPLPNEDLQFQF